MQPDLDDALGVTVHGELERLPTQVLERREHHQEAALGGGEVRDPPCGCVAKPAARGVAREAGVADLQDVAASHEGKASTDAPFSAQPFERHEREELREVDVLDLEHQLVLLRREVEAPRGLDAATRELPFGALEVDRSVGLQPVADDPVVKLEAEVDPRHREQLPRRHGRGPGAFDLHGRVDAFEAGDRRLDVPVPESHVDGAGDPFALPPGASEGLERARGGVDPLRQDGQQMRRLKPPGLEAHPLDPQRRVSGGGQEVVASPREEREAALGGARPQVEADRGSRRLELRVDREAGDRERLRLRGRKLEGLELRLQVTPALAVVERGGDLEGPDGSRGRDADVFERGLLERQHGKASARHAWRIGLRAGLSGAPRTGGLPERGVERAEGHTALAQRHPELHACDAQRVEAPLQQALRRVGDVEPLDAELLLAPQAHFAQPRSGDVQL